MLLYIIRHAWAEERDAEKFPDDDLRPLTHKGKKRFAKFISDLLDAGFEAQLIATSRLVRCRETAELIVDRSQTPPRLVELEALRPHSDLDQLLAWTAEQRESSIVWVGHEPDVSELTAALIGHGHAQLTFSKGAVAAIEFDDKPQRGEGVLLWLVNAKLLGR